MRITAFYAALLVPLLIVLSVRVIGMRRAAKVAIGHSDDHNLLRAMRVHANFTEYVPMALLMMALAESLAAPQLLLHAVGIGLVVGRLTHAVGVSQTRENINLRVTGMMLTFTVLGILAATCFYLAMA